MQERYAKDDVRQATEVKPMRYVLGASILLAGALMVAVLVSFASA
ncbi:hypothetical protein [Pelagibius sp.]